jgi:proteasome accessory factor A
VVHDRAGERILEGLLVDAEKRLHDEGIAGDIYLFKNNTDSAGNSYGCHENYLVSRHGEFGRLADILIPFLVTRQLICGAGKVLQTPAGAVLLPLAARRAHLGGRLLATTRSPPDHQHPRRAARRRRALPAPARRSSATPT